MTDTSKPTRSDYVHFDPVTTRWMDNDLYGHVNNVTYYSYFDSAVNRFLIAEGGLDIHAAPVVGFVVQSSCNYLAPVAYPTPLDVGLRVDRLGRSSVTYGLGIFQQGDSTASAYGSFTHVFVDRTAMQSVPIPAGLRTALERLRLPPSEENDSRENQRSEGSGHC